MSEVRRLRRLEATLGPEDKLRAVIEEAHGFDSFFNYLRFMTIHDDLPRPLTEISLPLSWGLTAARNEANQEKAGALLRSHERAFFLYFLHKEVNLLLLEEEQALRLRLVAAAERGSRMAVAGESTEEVTDVRELAQTVTQLQLRIEECLAAAGVLSTRYFGQVAILFPDLRRRLEELLSNATTLQALVRELLPAKSRGRKRKAVAPGNVGQTLITRSILAARAATLEALGRTEKAARVRRQLASLLAREMAPEGNDEGQTS